MVSVDCGFWEAFVSVATIFHQELCDAGNIYGLTDPNN